MSALIALLKDRRRSQRGSVLSAVLIMTAFIAILSGALMTELSTNFLLSDVMLNRVSAEATVNSATELAISQLQATPISAGCPSPSTTTLNSTTVAVAYLACRPAVDSRSPRYIQVAPSAAFQVDGSQPSLPGGIHLYIVGDSGGSVYQYSFGSSSPVWSWQLPGSVAGPPLTVHDPSGSSFLDLSNLVPLSVQSSPPPGCQGGGCVALLPQDAGASPDGVCYMAANGPVTVAPAAGINNPSAAFFGDQTGAMFAYDITSGGNCARLATAPSGGQAVVAGPIVFAGPTNATSTTDEVYVVTSDGSSSWLRRYAYITEKSELPTLGEVGAWQLTAASAQGLAAAGTTLPARIAITFGGGQVQIVQIQSSFGIQNLGTAQLPSGIADAPYWCHCPAGDQIAAAGTDGSLYLLNTGLSIQASFPASGTAITTTPATDSVGDWFFGAADGYIHEVQQPAGSSQLVQVDTFGQFGAVGSAVQAGACAAGICLYAGTSSAAYLVQLDARDATFTACVATSPPSCSGTNPRLWASVEVGAAGSPQTVHIDGWSYYSG